MTFSKMHVKMVLSSNRRAVFFNVLQRIMNVVNDTVLFDRNALNHSELCIQKVYTQIHSIFMRLSLTI